MRASIVVLAAVVLGLLAAPAARAGFVYTASLSGAGEPDPSSTGTGFVTVTLDPVAHMLTVDASFSGLLGNTTASHIHAPTLDPLTGSAGVATQTPTFLGFPLGVTSGTYQQTFDTTLASTWNASYITANGGTPLGAEAALLAALDSGRAYFNIHSTLYTPGEIRGFLVPEPCVLGLIGVAGLGLLSRPRRARAA